MFNGIMNIEYIYQNTYEWKMKSFNNKTEIIYSKRKTDLHNIYILSIIQS